MSLVCSEPRDLSRCFGLYQQQSVAYALTHCMACPKMKACVRSAWGVGQFRRSRRDDWQREDPREASPATAAGRGSLAT